MQPNGHLKLNFHKGQWRAWNSNKPIVAIIAGTRSGKTSFGPMWLHREMIRKGPQDYLVAAPTLKIIERGAGPDLEHFFKNILGVGRIREPWQRFDISEFGKKRLWPKQPSERRCRIMFGHGDDPESCEALGAGSAWLDECGQKKFKLDSYLAIQRRLHIARGRLLITTTPYTVGWLKQLIFDPWERSGHNHPLIDVINFRSTENPAFPVDEYERAKTNLPGWKFRMFYDGIFERPAGLIYDCFDEALNLCPRFAIPHFWPRWIGLDFGAVNTAGIFLAEAMDGLTAERPGKLTGQLFAYREYFPRSEVKGGQTRTAKQHVEHLRKDEPRIPRAIGGSKSEEQWRAEFRSGGLPVQDCPVTEVEVGIDRVYAAMQKRELIIFDDLDGLRDELGSYSRELDEQGNPTEEIEDKETYHRLDALRYIVAFLKGGRKKFTMFA